MSIKINRQVSAALQRLHPSCGQEGEALCERTIALRCKDADEGSTLDDCVINGSQKLRLLPLRIEISEGQPLGPINPADWAAKHQQSTEQEIPWRNPPKYHFGTLGFVPASIEFSYPSFLDVRIKLASAAFEYAWALLLEGRPVHAVTFSAIGSCLVNSAPALAPYDCWDWEAGSHGEKHLIITSLDIAFECGVATASAAKP